MFSSRVLPSISSPRHRPRPLVASLACAASCLLSTTALAAPPVRTMIDAVVEGQDDYEGTAYFFAKNFYVPYDMDDDVVAGGPVPSVYFPLKDTFTSGVDAAISGQAQFEGYSYFFKGAKYESFTWETNKISKAQNLSIWNLPAPFSSGVDAAVSGHGPFEGWGYFFRGAQYISYNWAQDKVVGAPKALSVWKLPAAFATGIDAVVNGANGKRAYFFRNHQYVAYDWAQDKPVNGLKPIEGNWPGLLEMVSVARAAAEGHLWVKTALQVLKEDLTRAQAGQAPKSALIKTALATHFHLVTVLDRVTYLPLVIKGFEDIDAVLLDPQELEYASPAQAAADGLPNAYAYAAYNTLARFTSHYNKLGPMAQTAVLVHELVHYTNPLGGVDIAYEGQLAEYAALWAVEAVANASCYPTFAEHVYFGKDVRYGGLHPDL
jgi:hypothetical protein